MYFDDISIKVFLGTWCSDSRREVPRFIKILNEAGFDMQNLEIMCLDRDKKAPDYTSNTFNIQYVPTFIVYQKNKELGRIIETPENTLETDLLKILSE
ncbi:MAG: thioredoxin family protein [Saprospiraceae bacterium]